VSNGSLDSLDVRLEALLRQWHAAGDLLFALHPIDGSLLVWTLDGLDDVWRQPALAFTFRMPNALPLTDAVSLRHNLLAFNAHHPVYVHLLQKHHSAAMLPIDCAVNTRSGLQLLTAHDNGTLNLWHLAVDPDSYFTTLLNLTHRARMQGHRFNIDRVVCHPVLPLLLTTSHHMAAE
jgi:hypothetical protein